MKPLTQWTGQDLVLFLKGIDKATWVKIGIGAGTFLVVFIVFIRPAWFLRGEIRRKVNDLETQIVRLETLRRNKTAWVRDKEESQSFIQEVRTRLYRTEESSLLLGRISKLAEQSGISIISSRPQTEKTKFPPPFDAQFQADAYDFTAEGGYHEFGKFISLIESAEHLMRISQIHVNSREKDPRSHLINFSIRLISLKNAEAGT